MTYALIAFLSKTSASGSKRECTVKDDLKYRYSDCDANTNKANVHFYYDPDDNCKPPRQEDDKGNVVVAGSDDIPPYYSEAQCNWSCEDG